MLPSPPARHKFRHASVVHKTFIVNRPSRKIFRNRPSPLTRSQIAVSEFRKPRRPRTINSSGDCRPDHLQVTPRLPITSLGLGRSRGRQWKPEKKRKMPTGAAKRLRGRAQNPPALTKPTQACAWHHAVHARLKTWTKAPPMIGMALALGDRTL
jgi:hypothetical protein